jgi:ATP-binding cassette, subfamily B, bacterial
MTKFETEECPAAAVWSLVSAVSAALRDGSLGPLRSLATRRDEASRTVGELATAVLEDLGDVPGSGTPAPEHLAKAAWSLVAAVSASGNTGSVDSLSHLAGRRADRTPETRIAAELAAALLDDLGSLDAKSESPLPNDGARRPVDEERTGRIAKVRQALGEAAGNGPVVEQQHPGRANGPPVGESERSAVEAFDGESPDAHDLSARTEAIEPRGPSAPRRRLAPRGHDGAPGSGSREGSVRSRLRLRREKQSAWHFLSDFPALLPYLRRYPKLALGSVSMIGVGALVSLLSPWPLAILLDTVLGNKPLPSLLGPLFNGASRNELLLFAVLFGLVVTAVTHGTTVVDNYLNTKLDQRLSLDFRSDLFRHAQQLSLAYHDQKLTGMLMFRLTSGADAAGGIVVAIPPLIQSLITVVLMLLVALRLDARLALIALGVVPFIYYSAGYYTKRIEPRLLQVRGLEAQALSIVYEAMSMLRITLAFGREKHEYGRFRQQQESAVDARVKLTVRQTGFSLAVSMITAIGTALVLGLGAHDVLRHKLTAGELMVMLGYVAAIYGPLQQISQTFTSLQQSFINLRSGLELLETEPEIKDAPDAVAIGRAGGRITFDNVEFAYEGRETTVSDISFDIEPGRRVAIVGPTGAGKTTLVSLMMRFYDPQVGRLLLDGVDIRQLKLSSLRDQISLVLQEPLLFSGTIYDNIRYGKLEATEEEIVEAAKAANAHDFLSRLPDGYQTEIGERGAQLSGGERQRICVARAFLKDAPILVLDEPTSSIDSKTEAVILDALDRLMEGRTSFMIAHRLSTVHDADLILVLHDGSVVERGTHEQLLARGGLYSQLWRVQAGQERRRRSASFAEPDGKEGGEDAEHVLTELDVTAGELWRLEGDQERPHRVADIGTVNGDGVEHAPAELSKMATPNGGRKDNGQLPQAGRSDAMSLLIAAVSALAHGTEEPLIELAARTSDPDPEARFAAKLAAGVLGGLQDGKAST